MQKRLKPSAAQRLPKMLGRETKRRRKEEESEGDSKDDVGLTLTQIAKIGNTYGHPYGVQLLGNKFASESDTPACSLGACFDRLGDVKVLQFLETYVEDANMLGKLAMVNRAFYVLSRTCLYLFLEDTQTHTHIEQILMHLGSAYHYFNSEVIFDSKMQVGEKHS